MSMHRFSTGGVKPYYTVDAVTLYHGDALEVLRTLPDESVDAVCTDPPYGLEFMGREWDSFRPASARIRTRVDQRTNPAEGKSTTLTPEAYVAGMPYQQWCQAWAIECLRVLKPGGHLLAFGGTRTAHRLTCAIEDAGFEIRDGIDWIYGSGFPKSLDVSKAIDKAAGVAREVLGPRLRLGDKKPYPHNSVDYDGAIIGERGARIETAPSTDDAKQWEGWGTALKPAREPIVVARKPLAGTVAANVQAYGTGALNIDVCRVDGEPVVTFDRIAGDRPRDQYRTGTGENGRLVDRGRWPSNVVLSHASSPDGVDLCADGCVEGCPVAELDRQSGERVVGWDRGTRPDRTTGGVYGTHKPSDGFVGYADSGGASRFFPVFRYEAKADSAERPRVNGVTHPTVKPLALMRWLVRLVTPPGGVALDPFAGSGTTAEACVVEGFRCVAVEREADYLPLIVARLSKPIQPVLFGGSA